MQAILPDEYSLKARWIPGFILLTPLAVYLYGLPYRETAWLLIQGVVCRTIILAFLMFPLEVLIRRISKCWIEGVIFKHGLAFPTTEFLLHSNEVLSTELKKRIRDKVKSDFDLTLPSVSAEQKDEANARKRIAEAVRLIQKDVDKGRRIIDYNIVYGFWRNLLGAAILGVVMATALAFLACFVLNISWMVWTEIVLATLFIVLLLFRRPLLRGPAEEYARSLLTEYAATQPKGSTHVP